MARLEEAEADIKTLHARINTIKARFWWAVTVCLTQFLALIMGAVSYYLKGGFANN